jgi:hypothetical protein
MGGVRVKREGRGWCRKAGSGLLRAVSWLKRPFCGCLGLGDTKLVGNHAKVVPIWEGSPKESDSADESPTHDSFHGNSSRSSSMESDVPGTVPFKGCQKKPMPPDGCLVQPGPGRDKPENAHARRFQKKFLPGTGSPPCVRAGMVVTLLLCPDGEATAHFEGSLQVFRRLKGASEPVTRWKESNQPHQSCFVVCSCSPQLPVRDSRSGGLRCSISPPATVLCRQWVAATVPCSIETSS